MGARWTGLIQSFLELEWLDGKPYRLEGLLWMLERLLPNRLPWMLEGLLPNRLPWMLEGLPNRLPWMLEGLLPYRLPWMLEGLLSYGLEALAGTSG